MARPKGSKNHVSKTTRTAIGRIVGDNFTHKEIERLINKVEREEGAKAAFGCYVTLVEYVLPKLARVEHTGEDGGALTVEHMIKSLQSNPVQMRGNADIVPNKTAREASQPVHIPAPNEHEAREKPLKLAMSTDQSDYDKIIDHDMID